METHDALLPHCVVVLELFLIALHHLLIEGIILCMLLPISTLVFLLIVHEQLIDLGLQQEGDRDQIFPELAEEAS